MKIYNLPPDCNITNVQLTVKFRTVSRTVTVRVSEVPMSAQTPAAPGKLALLIFHYLIYFSMAIMTLIRLFQLH